MAHMVMARCPKTGNDIATGIVCDLATFNSLAADALRVRCPACGDEHAWTVAEAWLAPLTRLSTGEKRK